MWRFLPGSQYLYRVKPILIRRTVRATPGLPELVSEDAHLLRCDFVSESAGSMFGRVPVVLFLRLQVRLVGVLEILAGAFVPGQMIFFPMVLGSGGMGVGGKVTVLSGYLL